MTGKPSGQRSILPGHPYRSKFDPAHTNNRHPPHQELAQADSAYYRSHALTAYAPTVQGQLPPSLTVAGTFANSVWKALEPAEQHWTSPVRQSEHKQKHYWHRAREFAQAFSGAMEDLEALIDALQGADLPQNAPVLGELATLKTWTTALRARVVVAPDRAYTIMAQVLLQVAALAKAALQHFDDEWIKDIDANIQLSIEYPKSDSSSYTLQLNSYFCGATVTGDDAPGYVICGIRLGRSQWWVQKGNMTSVVYLNPAEITTTFYAVNDPGQQTTGFVCHLEVT